jgi:acyl carrier protein
LDGIEKETSEPARAAAEQAELQILRTGVAEALDMDPESIEPGMDLLATGRMDSLAIVNLLAFIEEAFAVSVPIESIVPEKFSSLESLRDLIVEVRESPDG